MSKQILTLDSSQIVQFLKCPTFHHYCSTRNLVHRHVSRAAMDRGTVMHGLIQRYYHSLTEQESPTIAMQFALGELNTLKQTVNLEEKDYDVIARRFTGYMVKYYTDKIKVAVWQGRPALEIGFSIPILDNDQYYFVLEGKIDMISVMSDQLIIWDHKCQSREYYLYGYTIQMLNYALAVGTKQTMHNYIRLHQKEQPNTYVRKLNYIPGWLLNQWKVKLQNIFHTVANRTLWISENEKLYYEIHGKDFPNQSCSDIGFGKKCPFTDVCQEQLVSIQEQIIKRDFQKREPWKPWSLEESLQENGE